MKKLLFLLCYLFIYCTVEAQVVINEYSCSNYNSYLNSFNSYDDWVELYNNGSTTIDLAGYYLSDDPSNIMAWQIPSGFATTIAPGAKKMIFANSRDTVTPGGQIHTNFKLTQSHGNWIILSNTAGVVIDSLQCRLTQRGHSRGRTTDGAATWGIFSTPTPNGSNATQTAYTAYATKPIFNINAGNYLTGQSIVITSPDPLVTLHYDTIGTIPTLTDPTYSTPINVSQTVAIRARAFSSNPSILPSFVETNTYFINDVVDSRYNVVSLCGPFNAASSGGGPSLFGSSAPAWSSLEYFDNNFSLQFEQEVLTTRHGNDSWAYAQKGMDVEAFDETGTKAEFTYNFFNTTLRGTFGRFIIKNAGSDNFPLGPSKSCHLRDVFVHTLCEKYNCDMDYRRFRPSIVFINGKYWGVYDFRERVDGEFFKYYYNESKKKCDHLSYWGGLTIRMGSDTGWVNLYNYIMSPLNPMNVQANYEHVKDFLNIKSFIQYFIINEYMVNHDWLNWNTMWWRARDTPPVKWRYALWDEDAVCGLDNPNYTGVGTTGPTNDPCEPTTLFQNNSSIKHTDMLKKLFNNPEFEQTFKDEWINMLNGPLSNQNLITHFDSLVNVFAPEMPRHTTRWGGNIANWNANIDSMRAWLNARSNYISGALSDTGCLNLNPQLLKLNVSPANAGVISLNGIVKSPYVWSKTIEGDSIYTLKATPTAGQYWTFDHWEKQNAANSILPITTTDNIQFDFKQKDSVIAFFKYFNYDSVDVTFDVTPPGTGTIKLNGTTIASYPTTITLDRQLLYNIEAVPNINHNFVVWQKNNINTTIAPSLTDKIATLKYVDKETVVAEFVYIPPPPPPPPLPVLTGVDNSQVFIPNGFSPNADGKNDLFSIQIGKDAIGMDMVIFDRWGKEVYHTNNINKGWDGTYNGKAADIGVYQYLIKVKFRDHQTKVFQGDLTVLR